MISGDFEYLNIDNDRDETSALAQRDFEISILQSKNIAEKNNANFYFVYCPWINRYDAETKYLDDAYYILGKSSYLIGRPTSAKYYFNRLLDEFPNSEISYEVLIWLSYIDFKIGYVEKVKNDLLLFKSDYENLDDDKKYLIDLLHAKVSNYENNFIEEKSYYLSAIIHSSNKNQKTYLYKKILLLAENEKNYEEAILYIENINQNTEEDINLEMLEKWFNYNRLVKN